MLDGSTLSSRRKIVSLLLLVENRDDLVTAVKLWRSPSILPAEIYVYLWIYFCNAGKKT
jgi:hypothetical protein